LNRSEVSVADPSWWGIGFGLILIGFALIFIAMIGIILSGRKGRGGKVKGGGAIIIGPIPIVFGTDKESVKIILILSIVLVALLLVLMIFSNGLFR
jgi:uncharacterized protein (TIGR00304 family)